MSWLLVVQPDPVQADALCDALRGNITEDIVVAESLDAALSLIEEGVPDVILLPSLMPADVEDYLVAYLGAIPGADHVQILGLPVLRRPAEPIQRRSRSIFPWRRRRQQEPPAPETPGYDSGAFTKDVIDYLAGARMIRRDLALYGPPPSRELERRREPRFPVHQVPWISLVSFAGEHATLIDVSARGALLRTSSRPRHDILKRPDPNSRSRPRLVLKLESHSELQASGQVIRCVPVRTSTVPQYDVAFSFDEAVGLHLPWSGELVPSLSAPKALPRQLFHDPPVEQPKYLLLPG
jgi:CheY-like chemotaxis protein